MSPPLPPSSTDYCTTPRLSPSPAAATGSGILAYLIAAKDLPPGQSRIFEIGGADVVPYGDLVREYARQRGLHRWLISVPVLTSYLSSLWLALVTPKSFEVGKHLIEGLRNPTIVRDKTALTVFAIRPVGIREAVKRAIASTIA